MLSTATNSGSARIPVSVNVRITSNGRFIVKNVPASVQTPQPSPTPPTSSVVVPDLGGDGRSQPR